MINSSPIPNNEAERLAALNKYKILDSSEEHEFDRITQFASLICDTPIALITFIDGSRQWFKSKVGLDFAETTRENSFCQYAILNQEIFTVEDTSLDSRFKNNPMVTTDPEIKSYAGYPLITPDGLALGTLCVLDKKTRKLNNTQLSALKFLADEVVSQLLSRLKKMELDKVEKLFDLSQDFICITGVDGYFKRINPIFIEKLGYSESFLMSKPISNLIHEDDIKSTIIETEKLSKGEVTLDFVNRYRKQDGKYITLNWLATFDEPTQEIYAIARDITENVKILDDLKKSRALTEKAMNAKDEFLTNMSHEIRTPLNAIIGFNSLLQKTPLNSDQIKYVSTVNIASQNLMVLVNDILDSAKLDSGNVQLEKKSISLKEVADQVFLIQSNAAKSKGIKLVMSLDRELPEYVIGDQTRLMQILVNLVNNAIKFTDNGNVELSLIAQQQNSNSIKVRFSVKDTGIGIDKKKLEAIFERFVQAENSTTRIYGGTGLGLNIVKMLVELYKGKLEVQSALKEGSEFAFEIEFPVSKEDTAKVLIHEIPERILENTSILIVEDNEHNQFLAKTFLERKHAKTEIAENGEVAIEKIKATDYDIILMDLQMPKMDGYEATKFIRNQLKSKIPIIGCSAHSLVGEKEKCIQVGMNDYIAKPYSESELVFTIAKFLTEKSNVSDKNQELETSLKLDDFDEIITKMSEENGQEFRDSMVSIFIRRMPENIKELEEGVKNEDLTLLSKTSHLLAGSFSSMNFVQGNLLAKKIESYSKNEETEFAIENTKRLIFYIEQALKTLKN